MLIHVRISLPDKPGALGQIGALTGSHGADIVSMQVLTRMKGRALDDLYLSVPDRQRIATIIEALESVQGVRVHGMRDSAHVPGAHPDLDLLGHVLHNPDRGLRTLTDMAPTVFTTDWAALQLVQDSGSATLYGSVGCPDPLPLLKTIPHRPVRDDAGDLKLAMVPLHEGRLVLVIGRDKGPAFHPIELSHLNTVVELTMAAGAEVSTRSAAHGG
jgi:hypothetical protein